MFVFVTKRIAFTSLLCGVIVTDNSKCVSVMLLYVMGVI
jgi:hypothetical protein